MIHNIKHIHELYNEANLAAIKEVAAKADRLGLTEHADKIFALHFECKKSLVKANNAFIGLKKIIKTIEVAAREEENDANLADENVIREMRFQKGFPMIPLNNNDSFKHEEALNAE